MKTQTLKLMAGSLSLALVGTGCLNGAGYNAAGGFGAFNGVNQSDQFAATSFDALPTDGTDDTSADDGSGINLNGGGGDTTNQPPDPNAGIPPLEFSVHNIGYTAITYFHISTNHTLKVAFRADPQQGKVAGTNFTPTYTGLGVYLGVGSVSHPTPLLYNGANGGEAQTSAPVDLSGAFTKTCAQTDTACRQSVTIKVTQPNYDFYCVNFPGGFVNGDGSFVYPCNPPGYTHVYKTHPWYGTLFVYTDDTEQAPAH
jgi:hypothetical protein